MSFPTVIEAEEILSEAKKLNPGPWVDHSKYVGIAAEIIASYIPELNKDQAKVLGLLHDIGRRVGSGSSSVKHAKDGYDFAMSLDCDELARICLTHSFPIRNIDAGAGKSISDNSVDQNFVQNFLDNIEYDDYDKLIQLCDALAMPSGCCLIEKRLFDVAFRHGVNEYTEIRWKVYLELFDYFEKKAGRSLYSILPNVVENTFKK